MKYSELHRRFIKAGWKFDHAEGSHYFYSRTVSYLNLFLIMALMKYPRALQTN